MRNGIEKRVYIAATSQNDGKTSCSIGLLQGLRSYAEEIGFIKPVGQRYMVVGPDQIDEDAVLISGCCNVTGALKDMSPVAVPKYFTREYLDDPTKHLPELISAIDESFVRIAENRDLILIEGTGHAGVGSVFDMSNATVAKQLKAKVIIVTLGGIGHPADEIALNKCLFESAGVEVIGVIANKVVPEKAEQTRKYLGIACARMGLKLFGVIPYAPQLTWPTVQQICEKLRTKVINGEENMENPISAITIGAMTPHNALTFVHDKTFFIVPGDRDDLVIAAASMHVLKEDFNLGGLLFTGGLMPQPQTLDLLARTNIPTLTTNDNTYEAASKIYALTIKIRTNDADKIKLAVSMVKEHVDLQAIWEAL